MESTVDAQRRLYRRSRTTPEELQRLDPTGAGHGFLAHLHRTLIRTLDLEEFKQLTQYADAARAGLFVIMALAKRRSLRISAAEILHQNGADTSGNARPMDSTVSKRLPATAQLWRV